MRRSQGRARWRVMHAPAAPTAAPALSCWSHQGNKQNNLAIVYTPASNLRKSSDMAVGQVRLGVGGQLAGSVAIGDAGRCCRSCCCCGRRRRRCCHCCCAQPPAHPQPPHAGGLPQRRPGEEGPCGAAAQRNRKPAEQDAGKAARAAAPGPGTQLGYRGRQEVAASGDSSEVKAGS